MRCHVLSGALEVRLLVPVCARVRGVSVGVFPFAGEIAVGEVDTAVPPSVPLSECGLGRLATGPSGFRAGLRWAGRGRMLGLIAGPGEEEWSPREKCFPISENLKQC